MTFACGVQTMQRIIVRFLILVGILSMIYGGASLARVDAGQEPDLTPRILDLWPAAGVTLASGDPVTVTFDQPMNKTSVETAIHIAPSIPGAFSWQDAETVVFTPSQ